jgi:hypothetical protein
MSGEQKNLSPAEFARETGLTLQYVYSLLAAGSQRLAGAQKIDGQWRIPTTALEVLRQRREAVSA